MKTTLGTLTTDAGPLAITEQAPTAEKLQEGGPFKVTMHLQDTTIELSLAQVRALRRVLAEAERVLKLRHDEALKARNLNLDF